MIVHLRMLRISPVLRGHREISKRPRDWSRPMRIFMWRGLERISTLECLGRRIEPARNGTWVLVLALQMDCRRGDSQGPLQSISRRPGMCTSLYRVACHIVNLQVTEQRVCSFKLSLRGSALLPRTTDLRSIASRRSAHPAGLADLVSFLNLRLPGKIEHGRRRLYSRGCIPGQLVPVAVTWS
jgi:hypothetical protein